MRRGLAVLVAAFLLSQLPHASAAGEEDDLIGVAGPFPGESMPLLITHAEGAAGRLVGKVLANKEALSSLICVDCSREDVDRCVNSPGPCVVWISNLAVVILASAQAGCWCGLTPLNVTADVTAIVNNAFFFQERARPAPALMMGNVLAGIQEGSSGPEVLLVLIGSGRPANEVAHAFVVMVIADAYQAEGAV